MHVSSLRSFASRSETCIGPFPRSRGPPLRSCAGRSETGIWPALRYRSSALDLAQRHAATEKRAKHMSLHSDPAQVVQRHVFDPFCVFALLFISVAAVERHLLGGWKELFMSRGRTRSFQSTEWNEAGRRGRPKARLSEAARSSGPGCEFQVRFHSVRRKGS